LVKENGMGTQQDLKAIRRRAYLANHEDGLIDIGLGTVFLLFGLIQWLGRPHLGGICWMPALFIAPMKRFITAPRIGTVRFATTGGLFKVKMALILFVLAVIGFIVTASLLHSEVLDAWTHRYFAPAFGFSLALIPLAGAVGLGVRRYYGYAVLMVLCFSILSVWRDGLALVFLAIGSVVTITGILVLIRFLRSHPVLDTEEHHA
jgi:hypothetical protein